jgi:hypothetical protein
VPEQVAPAAAATTATDGAGSHTTAAARAPQPTAGAPSWTSPALLGLDAPAQLQKLAAAYAPRPSAQGASLEPAPGGLSPRGGGGGSPLAPAGPAPCAAGAAGTAGGGPTSGAWAGLAVTPSGCAAPRLTQLLLPSPALWRPLAFVSIQERPG